MGEDGVTEGECPENDEIPDGEIADFVLSPGIDEGLDHCEDGDGQSVVGEE